MNPYSDDSNFLNADVCLSSRMYPCPITSIGKHKQANKIVLFILLVFVLYSKVKIRGTKTKKAGNPSFKMMKLMAIKLKFNANGRKFNHKTLQPFSD